MDELEIRQYIDFIEEQGLSLNARDGRNEKIIRGILGGKNYDKIASELILEPSTIRNDTSDIYKFLTEVWNCETIRLDNFQNVLQRMYRVCQNSIPLIYVRREPIETEACSANRQPGSLIRIKAPQKMGKTMLSRHILRDAKENRFTTITCDFGLFEKSIYDNYHLFLKTFCSEVMNELDLNYEEAEKHLHNNINNGARRLFEKHILTGFTGELNLALENFDKVLERENISEDFFKFLRHCHNKSSLSRLHLIIIHSTDVYGQMDINTSPLAGVGDYFELKVFNDEQVKELFEQHHLDLSDTARERIIELLSGHPYLLSLAIEELQRSNVTLEQLLEEASTESGIFRGHLRRLLDTLYDDNELREAYKKIVNSKIKVKLPNSRRSLSFQLYSLGLVIQDGNWVSPSCKLYRDYFQECL